MPSFKLIICLALFFSCQSSVKTPELKPNYQENATATFKKEIPTYEDGRVDLFYTITKGKEKQLGLDNLESGFDSLQIRIWYDYARISNRKLIIINKINSEWSAQIYEITVVWDATNSTEIITSKKVTSPTPQFGWDDFMGKLLSLKITELPNMDDIPNLKDNWKDGVGYHIEIATKNQYRFYGYHMPDKFADKFWQAKNMSDILDLVGAQLKESR